MKLYFGVLGTDESCVEKDETTVNADLSPKVTSVIPE